LSNRDWSVGFFRFAKVPVLYRADRYRKKEGRDDGSPRPNMVLSP
jgi:hypothetical protein